MPSEDSGDVWCVGTEGQDGVRSIHLLKLSRHPSSLDRTHGCWRWHQSPSGRVRLPLTVGTFADPLERAARGGASVGQKLVLESLGRVQLFFFFFLIVSACSPG